MFQQRLRPLEHVERRVIAIRYSLNEPVVETAEFPGAAARSAILVYLEDNLRRVVVLLHSSENGRIVLYEMRDEDYDHATGAAFGAALTFAESMGFLFDDEKLAGTTGAVRAERLEPLVQLLDRGAPLPGADRRNATAPGAPAEPRESNGLAALDVDLTKFRGVDGEDLEIPQETTLHGTPVARVRPVQKLAPEPPDMPPKLELLASF